MTYRFLPQEPTVTVIVLREFAA